MRPHNRRWTVLIVCLVISLVWGVPPGTPRVSSAARPDVVPSPALHFSSAIEAGSASSNAQVAPLATPPDGHLIRLKSRQFLPEPSDAAMLQEWSARGSERIHLLVQLDYIPRERAKAELLDRGLALLAYVPDYAWIASLPAEDAAAALDWPGVLWIGELAVDDKLSPEIRADRWGEFNLSADGTAAVYLFLHLDEALETGRALATAHGGTVTGEAVGIRMLMVELPKAEVRGLAAEEAVQWVEPAAPPLTGANDGSRAQIGVDTLQAAPYNLDGTNVDILVYDSGQAGDHVDFGSRLIHGDADAVSDHSTHVAGTAGGSGSGNPQWRGMAPNADLISYGTYYPDPGVIFYASVPDIEADWAQAQNTYGADQGTASLGSNVYQNYPSQCASLLGKYGAASVLIDQIVRGGNPVVGLGDKYITTWAAGNERGSAANYCGNSYGTITPPAAAKNPIHVGGSNTNNNTQYIHTSWGPTEDGRLKPIVTAGACQTSGDFGITSTDNNPVNGYVTKCGTSMATPAVAGGIALMLQHYRAVYNTFGRFWPSAAKAILMQTATDLGNPGPDYQWGYGQVDIHAAVDLISRKAFLQANVDAGQVDLYSLVIPYTGAPLTVSLAWDDWEATLNANPALINNLDLELVAPNGTVWRPWVLNPSSPANNATRGIDSRNNQEQVQVPPASVEAGTWTVRVRGTTVPHGPQDYALACEGCKPFDVGVCQDAVAGTALARDEGGTPVIDPETGEAVLAGPQVVLSEGERWQRTLEAGITTDVALQASTTEDGTWVSEAPGPYVYGSPDPAAQADAVALSEALAALESARQAGPDALLALRETLSPEALDLVHDEMSALQEAWADAAAPPPDTAPISEAEEGAARVALEAAEDTARAVALGDYADPAEGQGGTVATIQLPLDLAAATERTVGAGCTYPTIAAAIAAAKPGDRLLIEGGVTFPEAIVVDKNLTLLGGYKGCNSGSSARTTIDAGRTASVVTIASSLDVTLEHLNLTGGRTGSEGGGIEFALGSGTGTLRLGDVRVYGNEAQWGGGIWVGPDAEVIGSNVEVYDNTAGAYGGGVRLFGGRLTLTGSNIYGNAAPLGGGVYATQEDGYSPALDLPSYADVYNNQALTGQGLGGGVYLRQGTISAADCSDIYSNDAIHGGGAYVVTATLTINGSCSEIQANTATGDGGGVYAQDSTINLDDQVELLDNDAGTDGSGSGGGAYLDDGRLNAYRSAILYNAAGSYGGGVYATNGAVVDMDLGAYTCLGTRCSRVAYNTAALYGGGIYAAGNSAIYLDNTFVEANTAQLGGGLYAYESRVYLNSTLLARNNATSTSSGAGDAVRLYTGATLSASGSTFAYNDAGGASTGRAIDLYQANLSLGCSIIWGHASSIGSLNPSTPPSVSYSDVQGGYAGGTNVNVNPLFVASGSQDYHLQTSSPVIDRCPAGPSVDFDGEHRPIVRTSAASPYDMGADEVAGMARVGLNGAPCAYATIQQAVNAAADGDTVHVAAGTYFETVDIDSKLVTVAGGYDSTCTTLGSGVSRLEGSAGTGSTVDIAGGTVTLRNLQVAWGRDIGAGIDADYGANVTLDNVDVFRNHGTYGGGIYVGPSATVTASGDSDVHDNTATVYGGGVRVWGQFSGDNTNADIYDNCAPHGGGVSVPGGVLHLDGPDLYLNLAADAAGQGGGIHAASGGEVTLAGNVWLYNGNQAYDGAGLYADASTVSVGGSNLVFRDNLAAHDGGALYLANGSVLDAAGAQVGYPQAGTANEAQRGAGIYADGSTVSFRGAIINNLASSAGAGIYATGSTLTLTGATVGGTGSNQANALTATGHYGAGLYLTAGTHATVEDTVIAGNAFQTAGFTYGGGAYLDAGSVLTLTRSRVEYHTAPSTADGRGAGLYVNSSTLVLDDSGVLNNTAGTMGGGIRLFGNSAFHVEGRSSISHNESLTGEGGGIAAAGTSAIALSGAVLQHNAAGTDGGAIYLNPGSLQVDQTVFAHNSAARGGAIYQENAASISEVRNSLLYANASSAGYGAGIRVSSGSFAVTHVTLADNLGGAGFSSTTTGSSAFNSIAWGNDYGFWGTFGPHGCNIDQSSTVGTNIDPRFRSPGTDYHLLGDSPAVDACADGLAIDLEGRARPLGAGYDMGAYEFSPPIFLPVILRNY